MYLRHCARHQASDHRIRRTRIGSSRSAQTRSAVSTSAGSLRTASARQQRSPNDSARPPDRPRSAPASSASAAVNGSTVTPAALSSCRSRSTSSSASTNLPTTSAKLTAPRTAPDSSVATTSPPGSSWIRARMAEASRTVTRLQRPLAAPREAPPQTTVTSARQLPGLAIRLPHPAVVPKQGATHSDAGADDHRVRVRELRGSLPGSPVCPADREPRWHPYLQCATNRGTVARPSIATSVSTVMVASRARISTYTANVRNCRDQRAAGLLAARP